MIKIKNRYLFSPVFGKSMAKLKEASFESMKALYDAKRMCEDIEKHAAILAKDREELCAAQAIKGEDGKPKIVENKYQYPTPEIEIDTIKKVEELLDVEVSIERTALDMESITSTNFTIADLEILEPLFTEAKKLELV